MGVEKQLRVAAQLKLTKTVCLTEAAVLSKANDTVDNPIYSSLWGFSLFLGKSQYGAHCFVYFLLKKPH